MAKGVFGKLAAAALAFLGSGCETVQIFDTLTPKDAGGVLAERGIAYGSEDRQKLNIYVPKDADGKAPVLMFIYGGSWKHGARDYYDFAGRAFAAQGYVTVIADYRLVPDVVFPAFLEDGAAAVKWVEDNIHEWGGDTGRFFVAGHSAGAYNAIMLAVDPQWLDAAGVTPGLIDGAAGIAGPYDFYPFTSDSAKDAFDGAENAETATQPVALITAGAPALMLIHGTEDDLVEPRNAVALAARAEELGVPVTVKMYEGLDHSAPMAAISRPFRGTAPVLDDMVAFFESAGD